MAFCPLPRDNCDRNDPMLVGLMRVEPRPGHIPATIGTFFGGLWAFLAVMALPAHWRLPMAILATVVTVLLIARLWQTTQTSPNRAKGLFSKKTYYIAVVAEVLAIYMSSAILPRLGWQDYFIQVVGIIVGLHFTGLWAATRASRFMSIAGGMCLISATALFLPATLHLFNLRDIFTGFGNALVLWIGASRSS